MSSDLLEQAMIDAAALKEAAMKNAENALIEKYSAEFNQTVQKLLEQEDLSAAPTQPVAAPPADVNATPTPDLTAASADPMSGVLEMTPESDKAFSKVPGSFSGNDDELITINFDQIKATLNEMLGVKEMNDAGGNYQTMTGDASDKGGNPRLTVTVSDPSKNAVDEGSWNEQELEMELEEENSMELEGAADDSIEEIKLEDLSSPDITGTSGVEELEEVELEEQTSNLDSQIQQLQALIDSKKQEIQSIDTTKKAPLDKQLKDLNDKLIDLKNKKAEEDAKAAAQIANATTAAQPGSMTAMEESIELSEEELQELAEQLKVDINVGNLSDGYMGSTETQKREQRNVELAAARDEKATKDREEELKKMEDLVNENTELKDINNQVLNENNELKNLNNDALVAVASLKEQVEKLNVLNAKLLYTNKALANVSLNERQKTNIVESLSKADSVLAAKTIYETVQNAVEGISKQKEAPQSLRETLNRAATPFVVKKSVNNSISDLMAERMKALAGIKKLS